MYILYIYIYIYYIYIYVVRLQDITGFVLIKKSLVNLDKWLMKRGYLVRTQILKARGESRDSLLEGKHQSFRMSEAYCRSFKTCYHPIKSIKRFLLRFRQWDSEMVKAALLKMDNALNHVGRLLVK